MAMNAGGQKIATNMSIIKILERESAWDLEKAINEHLEDGWAIAQGHYQVCPESFWSDPSYSIIMLHNAPHVSADPETLALYETDSHENEE